MTESFKLQFSRTANNEAKSIIKYYRLEATDEVAERFKQELDNAVTKIVDNPERWTTYKSSYRFVSIEDFPYNIFYLLDESKKLIQIVAVAHEKRKPGYWLQRND